MLLSAANSNSGGCLLKSSRPGWVAYKSRSMFQQSQKYSDGHCKRTPRVPAASLFITVRGGVQLVCENHVIKSHPTSFQGRSKYLHWGYWESQLSTVCRVGTEAHTGFAPRYKINSLIKLSKEVRIFWPAQRSFPSLKGVTTEGAVVE